MSELYLSIGSLSKTPYYLPGLGVSIYSMDELCYYLVRDSYIVDNDLVDIKLCDYIENQLGLRLIAEAVRELINCNAALGEIVTTILEKAGYCSDEEIRRIRQILVDNASLSFAAKRKARGDNLVRSGKYSRAVEEYQYVLTHTSVNDEPETCSAIMHNIASAYAQMFLLDKAAEYYKMAYELDGSKESLTLYLAAMRMKMKSDEFNRMVVRCDYDERIAIAAQKRLAEANSDKEGEAEAEGYEADLKKISELRNSGRVSEADRLIDSILEKWKQDYRRSMDAGYL